MASIFLLFLLFQLLAPCLAREKFKGLIPNGMIIGRDSLSGLECAALGHEQCIPGNTRNAFGLDFKAAGFKWTKALCRKDSDKDGLTNGEELGDPCCEWAVGKTPRRIVDLSHPGDKMDTAAKKAKKCAGNSGGSKMQAACGTSKKAAREAKIAACFCYAVESGKVKPKGKKGVVMMRCRTLFGGRGKVLVVGKKACGGCCMKVNMKTKKKVLDNVKVLNRQNVFNKCFKNKGK